MPKSTRLSLISLFTMAALALAAAPGIRITGAQEQPAEQADAQEKQILPLAPDWNDIPGEQVFRGKYKHFSRKKEQGFGWLSIKKAEDGSMTFLSTLEFYSVTNMAQTDPSLNLTKYTHYYLNKSTEETTFYSEFTFEQTKARMVRISTGKEKVEAVAAISEGALFDPNTRPDTYTIANVLSRSLQLEAGETRELEVYDTDNSGETLVSYKISITDNGKMDIEVPAGAFSANYIVIKQLTTADTWFKKRAGHLTEMWTLDNGVIVRIVRHREPYELELKEWTTPETLPGLIERKE